MKKWEAVGWLKEKAEEGYITHSLLLELWDDYEEIPDDMLDLLISKPEDLYKPYIIIMGSELLKAIDNALEEWEQDIVKSELLDKIKEYKN